MPSFQRQRVFVVDLRLPERRCQLNEVEQASVNTSKTEVMWCATSWRQHLLPASALLVDGMMVDPVTSVRDLGIYIDADLLHRR